LRNFVRNPAGRNRLHLRKRDRRLLWGHIDNGVPERLPKRPVANACRT
jgi:hypothetical protein